MAASEEEREQTAVLIQETTDWRYVITIEVRRILMQLRKPGQGKPRPTIRRVFYILASNGKIPKTKSAYHRLSELLGKARLGWKGYQRLYDLDDFRDDTRPEIAEPNYRKPKTFVQERVLGALYMFDNYDEPLWEGQEHYVELMVEKQALVRTFEVPAKKWQVSVVSNKGNSSITAIAECVERWKRKQHEEGLNVHSEYFGDLDAFGENMDNDIKKKIRRIIEIDIEEGREPLNWTGSEKWSEVAKHKGKSYYDPDKPDFTFERIGLTEEQADRYNLLRLDEEPIKKLKPGSVKWKFAKRHGGTCFVVELDAIVIQQEEAFLRMVNDGVEKWYNYDIWNSVHPSLSEETMKKELDKRVKFKKLALKEYKLWQNGELKDLDTNPVMPFAASNLYSSSNDEEEEGEESEDNEEG